jgi:hypothetical protein
MATVRINFGISDELYNWIRTNPNIDSIERSEGSVVIHHHMSAQEAQTMKTAFLDKLIEPVV